MEPELVLVVGSLVVVVLVALAEAGMLVAVAAVATALVGSAVAAQVLEPELVADLEEVSEATSVVFVVAFELFAAFVAEQEAAEQILQAVQVAEAG